MNQAENFQMFTSILSHKSLPQPCVNVRSNNHQSSDLSFMVNLLDKWRWNLQTIGLVKSKTDQKIAQWAKGCTEASDK